MTEQDIKLLECEAEGIVTPHTFDDRIAGHLGRRAGYDSEKRLLKMQALYPAYGKATTTALIYKCSSCGSRRRYGLEG